jgi:hypothetical protein
VVPTLTFRLLFGFVILHHERRELLHIGVTDLRPRASPTPLVTASSANRNARWMVAQITCRLYPRPRIVLIRPSQGEPAASKPRAKPRPNEIRVDAGHAGVGVHAAQYAPGPHGG